MSCGGMWRLALGMTSLALGACASSGQPGAGGGGEGDGELRSRVEIIDGAQFAATWGNGAATVLRLTYDATVPVSDARIVEIAEQMTGCTVTSAPAEVTRLGELASVRLAASCPPPATTAAPAGRAV